MVYYYSAIQEKPDVTPQNPDTVPEKTENPDVTPPSSDTVQENPDMEPEIPADQPNAQDENLYPELYDTSNGTTGVQTGDKVIFSIITMIVAGAVIFIMNIGKRKIGKHENKN